MSTIATAGLVQKLGLVSAPPNRLGCAWIGPSPFDAELFTLSTADTDPLAEREHKMSILAALGTALADRIPVAVKHDDSSPVILDVFLSAAGF